MRSRGSVGNCRLGPETAAKDSAPGHSHAAAAVVAECARKRRRVRGGKRVSLADFPEPSASSGAGKKEWRRARITPRLSSFRL